MSKKPLILTIVLGLSAVILLLCSGFKMQHAVEKSERQTAALVGVAVQTDEKGNTLYNNMSADPAKHSKMVIDMMNDVTDPKADLDL